MASIKCECKIRDKLRLHEMERKDLEMKIIAFLTWARSYNKTFNVHNFKNVHNKLACLSLPGFHSIVKVY
jgi:hypothetical protein